MDKVFEILNAWWFKAAACGAIGLGFWIFGSQIIAGGFFGYGIAKLADYFNANK